MTVRLRNAALACIGLLSFTFPTSRLQAQEPTRWRLTPELRLGGYEFTRILAVLPASDGSVIIADAGNKELGVFSPSGAFVHKIGRNGRGPGEFELLRSVGLLGDTLWIIDGGARRTSLFSRDGKLLSTIRTDIAASGSAGWFAQLDALLPSGAALGSAARGFTSAEVPSPVLLMTRAGRTTDTLVWVSTRNTRFILLRPDGSFVMPRLDRSYRAGVQPFSDAPLKILSPSRPLLFIVDRSVTTTPNNSVFRVIALETTGDTLWNRSYPYVPKPMDKTRADSQVTALERSFTRTRVEPGEIRRILFVPDYYPPINAGVAGSDGSLWLRREEGKPTVDYWVLAKDGRLVATVTVPSSLTLMAVTESKAWAVENDEFDVPIVVRYSIHR
jgi:hypothetical protein